MTDLLDDVVGMTQVDAETAITRWWKDHGDDRALQFRVSYNNGKALVVTKDYNTARYNFDLLEGRVIRCRVG